MKNSRFLNKKVITIKHQLLLTKLTENCIKLRYRCNVFVTLKTCTSTIHEKHSIQQQCSKQLHSHVWTISLIMEPFPHILVQAESYKRVFAFLVDVLPVWQDTFAPCLGLKYSILSICFVITLSTFITYFSITRINRPWGNVTTTCDVIITKKVPPHDYVGENIFTMNMMQTTHI